MAMNLSKDPMFSTEKSLFSAKEMDNVYLMEECPDKRLARFGDYWNLEWKSESICDYKKEKSEKLYDDILDLLPSDPFGMDMSATVTAISGWFGDLEMDFGLNTLGFGTDEIEVKKGDDHQVFAGLNLVWNGAMGFYPGTDRKVMGSAMDKQLCDALCGDSFLFDSNAEDFVGSSNGKRWDSATAATKQEGCSEVYIDGSVGAPHDALFFALGYLGVSDLLSVERVCKSLRDTVRNDPLLWRSIHIDHPLSMKTTDDALLKLTSRAQGNLQCLSLVECLKITDSGLKRVLETNSGLTKLSVPGCVKLSVEGILCSLKEVFKSAGTPGIKHLRIGGLFGVTNKQFEEFKFLLGAGNHKQLSAQKPRFYGAGQLYLSVDDDRAIDIEPCPRCQKVRQVYDCPAESCQGKHHATQLCRACTLCIARCISCGCCIGGCEYQETFCLDLICMDCCKQLLNCQEKQEETSTPLRHTVFHQQESYHLYLCS
ncbi:unnamed protein product [Ilex paraguariensis]|uniref:F-box domain-containing protein n=1 Tax=Ilex paraguariensis TaxID=185542 RepID=A0ABC8UGP7_9AQUA